MKIYIDYKNKGIILPSVLTIIVLLLFLRDFVGVGIPAILFLALTVIVVLFANASEIITFGICLIPMLNAFQTKYALIILMIGYCIRFRKRLKAAPNVWLLLILIAWEVLHGVARTLAPVEIIRLFTELIFCVFIMYISNKDIDFSFLARSYALTTAAVCMIILLAQLKYTGYNVNLLFSGIYRFGYGINSEVLSVGFNPNTLSFICLSAIECICLVIYENQNKKFDVILIAALTVFGLLTMSKKFIICGLLFVMLYLAVQKNAVQKIKYFIAVAVFAVAIFFVLSKAFPTVIELVVSRFKESDITTGRTGIMSFYNSQLASDPKLLFWGVGYYGYVATLEQKYPGASIPHNGFQELVVMWGVLGLITFSAFLINMIKYARKINTCFKFVNGIPLIVLLVFCQAAQMVSSTVIVMLMAVANIYMYENTEKNV